MLPRMASTGVKVLALVSAAAVSPSAAQPGSGLASLPFYHSGEQIHQALLDLESNCHGASLKVEQRTAPKSAAHIDVVSVRGLRSASLLQQQRYSGQKRMSTSLRARQNGALKAMFVFGEHARELISAESGLHFLRTLCNGGHNSTSLLQGSAEAAASALDYTEFKVVVNANPLGRAIVENGDSCRRTNEDGVDLNRNWNEHFNATPEEADTNPGPSGFSEPETQILRDIATEFEPSLFLTVHSGALILGTPHGYDKSTPDNEEKFQEVLGPISEKYCDCPFGGLAHLLGYVAPGNAIDYAYDDLSVPYAFTWEIYANPDLERYYHWIRKSEKEGKGGARVDPNDQDAQLAFAFDSLPAHLNPANADDATSTEKTASLLQVAQKLRAKQHASESNCFGNFNPSTEVEYTQLVQKWTSAYLDLVKRVGQASGAN